MNIKLIQLINNDYIICEYEELDEEPSLYMKNPYRVLDLTYWDYNEQDKHFPPDNAVFLRITVRYPLFTDDVDILLNSDKIMTIVEPASEILTLYTQLISK
jgi:hypothetical protein